MIGDAVPARSHADMGIEAIFDELNFKDVAVWLVKDQYTLVKLAYSAASSVFSTVAIGYCFGYAVMRIPAEFVTKKIGYAIDYVACKLRVAERAKYLKEYKIFVNQVIHPSLMLGSIVTAAVIMSQWPLIVYSLPIYAALVIRKNVEPCLQSAMRSQQAENSNNLESSDRNGNTENAPSAFDVFIVSQCTVAVTLGIMALYLSKPFESPPCYLQPYDELPQMECPTDYQREVCSVSHACPENPCIIVYPAELGVREKDAMEFIDYDSLVALLDHGITMSPKRIGIIKAQNIYAATGYTPGPADG